MIPYSYLFRAIYNTHRMKRNSVTSNTAPSIVNNFPVISPREDPERIGACLAQRMKYSMKQMAKATMTAGGCKRSGGR